MAYNTPNPRQRYDNGRAEFLRMHALSDKLGPVLNGTLGAGNKYYRDPLNSEWDSEILIRFRPWYETVLYWSMDKVRRFGKWLYEL